MARPTKTQQRANAETKVRAEKASVAMCEAFSALIKRNIVGMISSGAGCSFQISGKIGDDGICHYSLKYQAEVSDGVGFKLDDGQSELPGVAGAPGSSTPAPAASSEAQTPAGGGE